MKRKGARHHTNIWKKGSGRTVPYSPQQRKHLLLALMLIEAVGCNDLNHGTADDHTPILIPLLFAVKPLSCQYLNENQEEANKVLVDVFNIGTVGDLSAHQVMAKAREKMDFNWKFTNDNFTYYQQLADTANDLGYVKQEVDVKSLFDLSFVEGVIEE